MQCFVGSQALSTGSRSAEGGRALQSACWQSHCCCYLTAAAGAALLPGAVDLAAGAAALHLLAAAAVNPAAADRLMLVKGHVVLQHLEEAGKICLHLTL